MNLIYLSGGLTLTDWDEVVGVGSLGSADSAASSVADAAADGSSKTGVSSPVTVLSPSSSLRSNADEVVCSVGFSRNSASEPRIRNDC